MQLEISVRRLREKFHGNITIDKAALLMRRYGNNHRRIAMEIVLMKDRGRESIFDITYVSILLFYFHVAYVCYDQDYRSVILCFVFVFFPNILLCRA